MPQEDRKLPYSIDPQGGMVLGGELVTGYLHSNPHPAIKCLFSIAFLPYLSLGAECR